MRMGQIVRRLAWFCIDALRLRPVVLLYTGYLRDVGWFRSQRSRMAVTRSGAPLPWISYPAIHFLEKRAVGGLRIFEYGSGNSTRWWAERSASVQSVEHDRGWYDRVVAGLPANARVRLATLGPAYSRACLDAPEAWHIVVIDGRMRVDCILACLGNLDDTGVIILDNSERSEYLPGIEFLADRGFRRLDFVGLAAGLNYASTTSIFYRDGNVLGV